MSMEVIARRSFLFLLLPPLCFFSEALRTRRLDVIKRPYDTYIGEIKLHSPS
jgi:hypothetical protein